MQNQTAGIAAEVPPPVSETEQALNHLRGVTSTLDDQVHLIEVKLIEVLSPKPPQPEKEAKPDCAESAVPIISAIDSLRRQAEMTSVNAQSILERIAV